uniref:Transposase n=1 Tax=Panagrellus redivivus TaxID=6233 RepID=A0A7E4UXE6_PANRE
MCDFSMGGSKRPDARLRPQPPRVRAVGLITSFDVTALDICEVDDDRGGYFRATVLAGWLKKKNIDDDRRWRQSKKRAIGARVEKCARLNRTTGAVDVIRRSRWRSSSPSSRPQGEPRWSTSKSYPSMTACHLSLARRRHDHTWASSESRSVAPYLDELRHRPAHTSPSGPLATVTHERVYQGRVSLPADRPPHHHAAATTRTVLPRNVPAALSSEIGPVQPPPPNQTTIHPTPSIDRRHHANTLDHRRRLSSSSSPL